MFRNKSVDVHQFAMIPQAEIPRSAFRIQKTHKTTFDADLLIPVYVNEVLPGDTFRLSMTAFGRMATPIAPLMDNLYLESFFFFVPCRLVWNNWQKFMGEQENPGDSTDFVIPQIASPANGHVPLSIYDYMGLPVTLAEGGPVESYSHSALPLRAYNLIWNEWFRDQNLQDSLVVAKGDGPDLSSAYELQARGKRHDYFTSCLPFAQKGAPVGLPLGGNAPIIGLGVSNLDVAVATGDIVARETVGTRTYSNYYESTASTTGIIFMEASTDTPATARPQVFADLSQATAATINQLRQAFQIQKLLERDARGGTRYTEILRAHFGVISPDARLQRPEYLGGGSTPVNINPIAQTSATSATGTDTPQGNLAAMGTVLARGHGFTQSFTEHGYVIGLVNVRSDLTYQQGLRRMWSRSTRYDFYFPVFAMLGEQAVLSKEIFCDGTVNDELVFGYQERWGEYRYDPSQITGLFRSGTLTTIDWWHLSEHFAERPVLNAQFIQSTTPMFRVLAVGGDAGGQEFLFDSFFDIRAARLMPMYSVPGLIDHF